MPKIKNMYMLLHYRILRAKTIRSLTQIKGDLVSCIKEGVISDETLLQCLKQEFLCKQEEITQKIINWNSSNIDEHF